MAPTLQATSRQRGGYVLKPRSMRPCSSQTRGVSAGKAANQPHLCLRHGFIGLSHDNFGAIEREIETMLELNDGEITVDLDKKQLQFYRLKTWFPIAIPKHPQTLPKSNDFWCV